MLTGPKLEILLERYFKHRFKLDKYSPEHLLKGKEYFIAALTFCGEKNADFPNLDLISTNNPDRVKDESFLFSLLNQALKIKSLQLGFEIEGFDENTALAFHTKNIRKYIKVTALGPLHNQRKNIGIIEKFQQQDLHYGEWLTDLDLEQLRHVCGLNNCTVTFCNFQNEKEAASNLGMALHFLREKLLRQDSTQSLPEKISIGLMLEVGSGSSFTSQGMHWASVVLSIDLNQKQIEVAYADSLFSFSREKIKSILTKAISFNHSEKNEKNEMVQFHVFPDYKVNININKTMKQMDFWSCGYRSFKHVVDNMPDNGNDNLLYIKALGPHSSRDLLYGCYNLLLNNQQILKKETRDEINTVLKNLYPFSFQAKADLEENPDKIWDNLKSFSIKKLNMCNSSKKDCQALIEEILKINKGGLEEKLNELISVVGKAEHKKATKDNSRRFLYLWRPHVSLYHQILVLILDKAQALRKINDPYLRPFSFKKTC